MHASQRRRHRITCLPVYGPHYVLTLNALLHLLRERCDVYGSMQEAGATRHHVFLQAFFLHARSYMYGSMQEAGTTRHHEFLQKCIFDTYALTCMGPCRRQEPHATMYSCKHFFTHTFLHVWVHAGSRSHTPPCILASIFFTRTFLRVWVNAGGRNHTPP